LKSFKNPALAPSTRQASLVASGPAAVRAAAERIFKIPERKIPKEFFPTFYVLSKTKHRI